MTQSSQTIFSKISITLTPWFYTEKVSSENKFLIVLILWLEEAAVKGQEKGKAVLVISLL